MEDLYLMMTAVKAKAWAEEVATAAAKAIEEGSDQPIVFSVESYGHANSGGEVTISVTNDDCEGRDDTDPDDIIVDLS